MKLAPCSPATPYQEEPLASQEIQSAPESTRPDLDEEALTGIACGHTAFQLLWAGAELDLYTLLWRRPDLTREEIARELKLESQPVRILLHGLTALRVLKKSGERYRNSRIVGQMLVRGKPGCIIPLLALEHHIVYRGMCDLTESLKKNTNVGLRHFAGNGGTLYQRLSSNSSLELIFQESMSVLSAQANAEFAVTTDLSGMRHLVDLGGGDGTNAINLARRYPHLKATVFDWETVTRIAKQNIATAGISNRVFVKSGDFLTDELPNGIDGILLAHIMAIWSPEKNRTLLKKCFQSLPDGGKLMIFHMVSHDDETGPLINALSSPYFQAIASGEGMLYCFKDYESWLREAGFKKVKSHRLPMEHALFVAEKE